MDLNSIKIGMGTFGSDKYDESTVANSVKIALEKGYRLFDCASVYGNERQIGGVFADAFAAAVVRREDICVMSKVWNDAHGDGKIIESCMRTLKDLRLEYVDVYFMHWPFPNYHAGGCSADSRNSDSRPFFVEEFIEAWRQMEWLKTHGYAREIAVSNMTTAKLEAVWPLCRIKPYALETELHPTFSQRELCEYCKARGMKIIGYCPLGSPNRPTRDRTPQDVADTQLETVRKIALAHGVDAAEVCIAWSVGKGYIPIPFAGGEEHIISNLEASNLALTDGETAAIDALECGNRLVKGHVFLWSGAADWHDLWDEDGEVEAWSFDGECWNKTIRVPQTAERSLK